MATTSPFPLQEVGVASGSGWNLWVWLLGVVVRRYIDYIIANIQTAATVLNMEEYEKKYSHTKI